MHLIHSGQTARLVRPSTQARPTGPCVVHASHTNLYCVPTIQSHIAQKLNQTACMDGWNLLLVRFFEMKFFLKRNSDWQTVCCSLLKKMCLTKQDPISIYFNSFMQIAYLCTTYCNSIYYWVATSYNYMYYLHPISIIRFIYYSRYN